MVTRTHVSEGLRMFRRHLKISRRGFPKYKGNAEDICNKILENCWNGTYLQTSAGHFTGFYARDFGWCIKYLLAIGKKEWAEKTLEYALNTYKKHGRIRTAITPKGKAFDFPNYYCIDAVAYMFYSLRMVGDEKLINKYKEFLQNEIFRFEKKAIDPKTGLVYKKKYFSAMKDHALRKSSCYDNTMAAFLCEQIEKIGEFENPLKKYHLKEKIKKTFWTGKFFKNDMTEDITITGDSNIYPFWTRIFKDKDMLKRMIKSMRKEGLDKPLPLKYVHKPVKEHRMILVEAFVKEWEQDTIWPQMGFVFIDIVKDVDKRLAKEYLVRYKKKIEENKNFLEVFTSKGTPYRKIFYSCDDSLSWACMYLALSKKLLQK